MSVDLCDDEILRELRRLHGIVPVPVTASKVSERLGVDARGVGRRLARLAEADAVRTRPGRWDPPQYVPRCADAA